MYNTMYLYVFEYHTKLCLSESLEACCYWKSVWRGRSDYREIDNHTVCIFPDVCHDIMSNLKSSCWGCLENKEQNTTQQVACTYTLIQMTALILISWHTECSRMKRNFQYDEYECTHTHTHTRNTHLKYGEINHNSLLCLQDNIEMFCSSNCIVNVFWYINSETWRWWF